MYITQKSLISIICIIILSGHLKLTADFLITTESHLSLKNKWKMDLDSYR
uniref:Uncharacterized protein n=1 Tax=Lepeophtheirus salmonis TaxID=72036 RepID=A0A0K2VIC5_LEPSM